MTPISISLNWFLLTRLLLATLWGISLALFLQFNRWGKFLAQERTWLTVVVGVGVDLLIAFSFDAAWGTTAAVIILSSAGIIMRSLLNESRGKPGESKALWGIEDATEMVGKLTCLLQEIAENATDGRQVSRTSQAILLNHLVKETLLRAGRGDYTSKRKD